MKIVRPMTPLRQRMLQDMQIRHDSPHTIDGSLRYVAQFAKHFHTSPDRLVVYLQPAGKSSCPSIRYNVSFHHRCEGAVPGYPISFSTSARSSL